MLKKLRNTIIPFLCIITLFNCFSFTANAANSEIVKITKSKFVADTLNGVDALYRPGSSDGSNSTYSCAAFVKKYYKEVYGVNAQNFFYNKTPIASGDKFVKVKEPQIGDIAACSTNRSTTHWAIVKDVSEDGTIVTLIEQNWKWRQDGNTVTQTNRTVKVSGTTFFRLESVDEGQ